MATKELLTLLSLTTIGLSGISIITGVFFILNKNKEVHKKCMLTACGFAAVFVVLYLTKSYLYEPTKYTGANIGLYRFVLLSHTILAMVNLPLAIYTVYLGLKDKIDKHKKVAPFTAAIWIYVALTGWAIYFFLHG